MLCQSSASSKSSRSTLLNRDRHGSFGAGPTELGGAASQSAFLESTHPIGASLGHYLSCQSPKALIALAVVGVLCEGETRLSHSLRFAGPEKPFGFHEKSSCFALGHHSCCRSARGSRPARVGPCCGA